MCPFDQLHAVLKDYIMLLHNRQRKKEARESKKYIVHHQNKVQA